MTDTPDTTRDWRDTVFLPKTDFPMKAGLAAKEPAILAKWQADDVYGRLREQRQGRKRWILHDGPPYANGDIHMGHAMNKVLKDIIVRSRTLMGYDAPFIPGWDCHGLPIEWKIEEAYRAKKQSKDEVPVDQFRAECRAYAAKWVDWQREQFKRLGVMGDWDDPYLTMNYASEAAIVAELLKFAESGQLYRGAKPVMWSPVEKTALAEAEVEYEDVVSTQIDVAFEILDAPNAPELQKQIRDGVSIKAAIWTTTPWTLPVNQALAYGEEVHYFCAAYAPRLLAPFVAPDASASPMGDRTIYVVVAGPLHMALASRIGWDFKGVIWEGKGSQLAGATARHPIYNLLRHPGEGRGPVSSGGDEGSKIPDQVRGDAREGANEAALAFFAKPRPFLPGDFVTTDAGTGLVHMAPDHGEDDFALCKAHGLDPVFAVDDAGFYRADWAWLGGQGSVINKKFVASDGPICSDLRAAGALLAASDDYAHSYPHSWRSKAKVIFRATPQWFIPMDRPIVQSGSHAPQSVIPAKAGISGDGAGTERQEFSTPQPVIPAKAGISGEGVGTEPHETPAFAGVTDGNRGTASAPSNEPTLRELALDAIERTRWVPEKGRNRIQAMVAGRPDWVISRQRAWGVPIALYVNRRTGDYLRDEGVNARIVQAFEAGGADAWFTADHQALLGPDHDLADWVPQNDILDVWFDSGSTHAFTIEARYGIGTRADLYLEGSDQHRGWFQSSLLESCGTRGRAPYDAVLTHGFALDGQGRKMSKSLGNVVDPLKVIGESGADILRLWVASTDYFEDVRIGKEVLAGTGDAYRKLRNTFRYLLGALDGWDEGERVAATDMPELERYVLHLLATLDTELKDAAEAFEFNRYARALTDFCNEDLSAFFFDIRKDVLYCDAPDSPTRRAYRTVLDTLFEALVRYAAPILCFTAEEAWATRWPDAGSVHLLEWPRPPLSRHPSEGWGLKGERDGAVGDPSLRWDDGDETGADALHWDDGLVAKWADVRALRETVTEAIEPLRREKTIRSSLEAEVTAPTLPLPPSALEEIFITARVHEGSGLAVTRTGAAKCGRCWRHRPEVPTDGALCDRCAAVVSEGAAA